MADQFTIECYPSWICPECYTQLTNDESPVDMSKADEQAWWEAYVTGTENYLVTPGTGPEHHDAKFCGAYDADGESTGEPCECDEEHFKEITCAICRRRHIGEAFRVTFWKAEEDEPELTKSDIRVWDAQKDDFVPISEVTI